MSVTNSFNEKANPSGWPFLLMLSENR